MAKKVLSVGVLEPSFEEKRRQRALLFSGRRVGEGLPSLEELRGRLKEIRRRSVEGIFGLRDRFLEGFGRVPSVRVVSLGTAEEVASYVKDCMGGQRILSLNKSNVVVNEIRPHLQKLGFSTYVRYFSEFKNFEPHKFRKQLEDYWALPGLHERGVLESFELNGEFDLLGGDGFRDYGAVLGVNVLSVDGSMFFLQHMSNISKDLEEARRLFLIIPLEKFTEDRDSALFQAKLTGILGLESILLDLEPREEEVFDFESLPKGPWEREVHLILYDNGRSRLVDSPYRDLLLCIDCRACARQCPVGKHVDQQGMLYSPKNYLLGFLLGFAPSFEACLHCGRCEVECPVDIDIPTLVWRSQLEYYSRKGKGIRKRLLDNPELMAKLGTMFPSLTNLALRIRPLRRFMEWSLGIHREAPMPSFPRETFRDWLRKREKGNG